MIYSEVIIIGAGPAGIATAIQLMRYGIKPLIFEKGEMGGLLRNANLVENYPGFPNGIPGQKLVTLFKKQFYGLDIDLNATKVNKVEFLNNQIIIKTSQNKYQTDNLVLASGTKPKEFSKFPIAKNLKNFIHYEISTLLKEKGKTFVIVGAGDAAFDYSLNLSKNNKVILLNRNEKRNCLPLLWERAKENSSIKYYSNSEINGINWDGFNLELNINQSGEMKSLKSDHLIFAIGRKPNLGFIHIDDTKLEELIIKEKIFMIGDVKNGLFRQASISIGDGVKVAMKIYNKKQESN